MRRLWRMCALHLLTILTTSVYWLMCHIELSGVARVGWCVISWMLFKLVFDCLFPDRWQP